MKKWPIFFLFSLMLGCSADVSTKHIKPYQSNQNITESGDPLYQAFSMGGVIGGQEANFMSPNSNIPNEELVAAFKETMERNSLLSHSFSSKFTIDLDLAEYRVSGPGLGMNVQTIMIYSIFKNGETKPYVTKRIHSEGNASVGDHLVGAARERIAAGRAISSNFSVFIEWIFTEFKQPRA